MRTRAVIYARVSTREQAEGESISHQLQLCREYCSGKGWSVIEECVDKGENGEEPSGSREDRPAYQRAIKLIQSGAADMLVAKKLDRITRKALHGLKLLEEVLEPNNAGLACVLDQVDTSTPMGRFFIRLHWDLAQHEVESIRDRILAGYTAGRQQGKAYGRPPYGTQKSDQPGIPVIEPSTWPIVEDMFTRAANGESYNSIATGLNRKDIPPPSGQTWLSRTVRNIIKNDFYLGSRTYDGKTIELAHRCRIPPDTWAKAQRTRKARLGRKPSLYPYVFRYVRLVTSHWQVTYPTSFEEQLPGNPVPLRPYHAFGRGGKRYDYYKVGHKFRNGGMEAEPTDEYASQVIEIPAADVDTLLLDFLILNLSGKGADRFVKRSDLVTKQITADLQSEIDVLVRKRATQQATRRKLEERAIEAVLDESRPHVLDIVDRKLSDLESSSRELDDRLIQLKLALDVAEQETERATELPNTVHVIQALVASEQWEPLGELLDTIIHHVDFRVDGTVIYLRPSPVLREALRVSEKCRKVEVRGFEPRALRMRTVRSTN